MDNNDPILTTVLNTVADAVIIFDENQIIQYLNRAAEEIFGYTSAEIIGKAIDILIQPHLREIHRLHFDQFIRSSKTYYFLDERQEVIGLRRNGEEFPVEISIGKSFNQKQLIISAFLRDISKRKNAEKAIHENEQRYRGLVESQSDLIIRVDGEGMFTFVNEAYCKKFGKNQIELLGKQYIPFVHPDDLVQTIEAMKKLREPPYRISIEQRAMTTEGWRWLLWEDAAIHNEQGELIEIQGIGRDITDYKKYQQLILSQRDLAQELAATSSILEALTLCLERVIQLTEMDSGGIYLVDQSTGDLELIVSRGLSEEFVRLASKYAKNTDRWQLVMDGKPIYAVFKELLIQKKLRPVRIDEGIKVLGTVPILHKQQVVACFNIASHTLEEFPKSGEMVAEEIAVQIGSAIVRIQAEENLRNNQKELQSLFNSMQDYIFVLGFQGQILRVNQQVIEDLGYTEDELLGHSVLEVHPPDLRAQAAKIVSEMVAGQTQTCLLELMKKNGERIPVETKISYGNWDTRPVIIGVSRSLQERLVFEEKLSYRSQFEDLLTQISTHFINLTSEEIDAAIEGALQIIGEFEDVDRSYVFLLNHQEQTMNNTHEWCAAGIEAQIENLKNIPLNIMPWWMAKLEKFETINIERVDELPEEAAVEKELLRAQDIQSVVVLPLIFHKTLNGFVGFDFVRSAREWSNDNIAMLKMFANILSNALERKNTESALRESEARNSALLNAIPDVMFRVNIDGYFLDFTSSSEEELVLSPSQIVGSHIKDALGEELGNIAQEHIRSVVGSNGKQTMDYELNMQGEVRHYEARFVSSGNNEVIVIVRNVSERAHFEQMKSDFINRATHDLRTPLTTILLMMRLLESECSAEERDEYWKILKEELERERQLIEDLLMVDRLENKRWQVTSRPVDPLAAIYQAIQTINPQAADKNIQIELSIPTQTPFVMGEVNALQQVFMNLLSNAVKFTPENGHIQLRITPQGSKVIFEIEDNGMGIPADDQANLFLRFFRGRNAIDNEVPGSGIGLFIVKSIIEHFGGNIIVVSKLGEGTTFKFDLPWVVEEES